ncbi:integral membrane protein [Kutzneria sp. CA-103260]|nr:integral membrane protein [Kutzneria sp. CA-103260]
MLVLATVATGLGAGLFYAFSCAVMPGLRRSDDATRVQAMQRINEAIQNPVFALSFAGAPLLTAVALVADAVAGDWPRVLGEALGLILLGSALVITFRINIPLNLALDRADPADPAAAWRAFERRWVRWNNVRTLATTAGLAALVVTLALI